MTITGLGPHGERSSPHALLTLSDAQIAEARRRSFRVAVTLVSQSEWARLLVGGIRHVLEMCGARMELAEGADADVLTLQVQMITSIMASPPDAVISLPYPYAEVAAAHATIARAGVALVLLDHVPRAMLPGRDYSTLVSADNFQLGTLTAEGLAPYLPPDGTAGLLIRVENSFTFQQREIGFTKWMAAHRPDVTLVVRKFANMNEASEKLRQMLANEKLDGLVEFWADPAAMTLATLAEMGSELPFVTVDLTTGLAKSLAAGRSVVAVAAQHPFQQGMAAAQAAILSRLGMSVPTWVAFPGMPVTRSNLREAYAQILQADLPDEIEQALQKPALTRPVQSV